MPAREALPTYALCIVQEAHVAISDPINSDHVSGFPNHDFRPPLRKLTGQLTLIQAFWDSSRRLGLSNKWQGDHRTRALDRAKTDAGVTPPQQGDMHLKFPIRTNDG